MYVHAPIPGSNWQSHTILLARFLSLETCNLYEELNISIAYYTEGKQQSPHALWETYAGDIYTFSVI